MFSSSKKIVVRSQIFIFLCQLSENVSTELFLLKIQISSTSSMCRLEKADKINCTLPVVASVISWMTFNGTKDFLQQLSRPVNEIEA